MVVSITAYVGPLCRLYTHFHRFLDMLGHRRY